MKKIIFILLLAITALSSCNNTSIDPYPQEEFDMSTLPNGEIYSKGSDNNIYYIVVLSERKLIKKTVPEYVYESLNRGTIINIEKE